MPLKDDLLRKGYLPENVPPPFTSVPISNFFLLVEPPGGYLMEPNSPLRAAIYNASKRGLTRRMFSAIHPVTAHDMAEFVANRWQEITNFCARSNISYSVPKHDENADRAVVINSHQSLEEEKIKRLSSYRFIASTDIARFYHSIYTHSIPWAYHGKAMAKGDRDVGSRQVFFNRADALIRNGQEGQTVGLPVGPDTSRVFAELIATAIDLEFIKRIDRIDYRALRHVDDVWIGTNSHADAEKALSCYREAIREFELDINEYKTRILAEDFNFTHFWPSEVSSQIEFAIDTPGSRAKDRLRSALEHCFAMAVRRRDDGVLKYVLRYVDQNELSNVHWEVIEPFLKRSAVHFGHTIDYVARILVWRHLAHNDLEINSWSPILGTILDKHGRLGNDSEVCWTVYAHQVLKIEISREVARRIVRNCGALAIVTLLHSVDAGLLNAEIFEDSAARLETETDAGHFWPVFLEWKSMQWPRHERIEVTNNSIEGLSAYGANIYDPTALPAVFHDIEEEDFSEVAFAIERRTRMYEEEEEEDNGDS